jgi:hypothetical protein
LSRAINADIVAKSPSPAHNRRKQARRNAAVSPGFSVMASMEYARMRTETEARVAEQARLEQQRRSAIVLMLHHMQREGFGKAVHALEGDSGVSLDRYEVCDNVDLLTVIQEFESYYSIKYNRPPKLIRKVIIPLCVCASVCVCVCMCVCVCVCV